MRETILPFSAEMIRLINEDDTRIVGKNVKVSSSHEIFISDIENLIEQLGQGYKNRLSKYMSNVSNSHPQSKVDSTEILRGSCGEIAIVDLRLRGDDEVSE